MCVARKGKAREEKRERLKREREEGSKRCARGGIGAGALLPLQSRVRPHSFICSGAGMLNLRAGISDDHPPRGCVSPSRAYMGHHLGIVHIRARSNAAAGSDSQSPAPVAALSRYSSAEMHALCNCARIKPSDDLRASARNAVFH